MCPAPESAQPPVLELRGFGLAIQERVILRSLDFWLPATGCTVLLGPSGTGKSFLVRTLAGLNDQHPSLRRWGEVIYLGAPLAEPNRPALVVQKAQLLVSTVLDNLQSGLPNRSSLTRAEQIARIRAVASSLDEAWVAEAFSTPVINLGLKQQRVVSILRAMLGTPALLMLDEPTTGMHESDAQDLLRLIQQISTQCAVLVVLHHLGHARSLADRMLLIASLEATLRDTLDPIAPRAMAVLDPVKLVITNWAELMGSDASLDDCTAPVNPRDPEGGMRRFKIGREVWIERTDYEDVQPKGFFRLFPGNKVRLKYGHTIVCTGATRDADGKLVEVQATLMPDTKSGTPGADAVKVKGNITWVAVADAVPVEVRLYERLFTTEQPGSGELLDELNKASLVTCSAFAEPSLALAKVGGAGFQFERHGYFVLDAKASHDGKLVFNRTAGMRDSQGKIGQYMVSSPVKSSHPPE